MDPPRKPGMRERFKGGLKEGKQRLKGHLSSRPASPLPSGTSTPQVVETEHDLPSNEQATDSIRQLPPLTSHVAEAHPHPIPNDLKNDPPAGPLPELTLSGVDSNTAKVEVPEGPPATPLPNQTPSGFDKFKDYANVTGSLLQLVLKKVPDAVDSNPVKVFFSLAKTVLELKEGMDDNKDAVEQHMVTISRLLLTVEAAQIDWTGVDASEEKQAMDLFQKEAGEQLEELVRIKNQSRFRNFALQEDDKQRIAQIFVCVDQARERLMLATTTQIHQIVAALAAEFSRLLPEQLRISREADYMYDQAGEVLGRSPCTPGTRISILEAIIRWATDLSDSECIFWLSGHAGTGKSTITLTICHLLETLAERGVDLGGTFFCSRQFPSTQAVSAIIRTLVYRLSLKSKAFKAALKEYGKFETVDHGPKSQLEALLVIPWKKSALGRLANKEPVYVLPIDALDELERERGSEFLRVLFEVIKEHQLSGLKFFVTSRLDPALVKQVEMFQNKQVCRLGEVAVKETNADIKLFLDEKLGECATEEQIDQLVSDAAGLFIHAATVVEFVKGRDLEEQRSLLRQLIATSPSPAHQPVLGVTETLDNLYTQILETCLVDKRDVKNPDAFQDRLSILHTFLCTIERTSTSVAVSILNGGFNERQLASHTGAANGILHRLHAVLYSKGGRVMWFHKSFPDFMFDKSRSGKFWCNQGQHHRCLAKGCFNVMKRQLRFNIANIPSSYQLDWDASTLASSIESNISSVLKYACASWTGHLTLMHMEEADGLLVVLRDFLQLQFLFWIEVMNLLGCRGCCQGMLRDTQKWAVKAKEPMGWAKELADAAAFAMYHNSSGAAASTPHLYISSLATFPRNSVLLQRWRHNFEGIPGFVNATGVQAILSSFVADSAVNAVAVAPDGVTVAIGKNTGLQTWDLTTGQIVKTFKGHTRRVTSVAFSPDSTQIVSGSYDESVRVWDVSSGEEVKMFEGHTRTVCSVAFSPRGTQVASASADASVQAWDLTSGEEVKIFKGHTDWVRSVTFSPDGTQIASGSDDQSVRVWDVSSGEELKTFTGHTSDVYTVAFSPNSTQVASGLANNSVHVWNISSREEVKTFNGHTKYVNSVAFSPDGTQVVSGSADKSVRVWDMLSGKELKAFNGHTNQVNSVAFSPDGTQVISSSNDQSVRVWEVSIGEEGKTIKGHTDTIYSVAFSPNGTQVASGSADHSVRVWDASSGEETRAFEGHTDVVNSVAFSPNGTLVVSGAEDKSIRVWDLLSGEEVKAFKGHTNGVTSVAFSPNSTQVVSGSVDNSIWLWDISSGEGVKTFNGHTDWVRSVAFSPNGTLVVSGSDDQSVRLWDVLSGEEVKSFTGHTSWVLSAAFSPDGTRIVSGSSDCSVQVWDVSTGAELKTFESHTDRVCSVAFSPDGTLVASGSDDGSVRFWNISSGEEVKSFEGHTGFVNSVAFSPDGTQVVSASADKSIRFWHCPRETFQPRYIQQKSQDKNHTGWLLDPDNPSAYLMFVPISANLPDDSNILTIPSISAPKLDLSGAKLGDRWTECYTPKSL